MKAIANPASSALRDVEMRGQRPDERQQFVRTLIAEIEVLEEMLASSVFETGVTRIGAEQELFVVDSAMRPAPLAQRVLEHARDPRLGTELALFNVEANLTPQHLAPDGLSLLHLELRQVVESARKASVQAAGGGVVMAGILPTLRRTDLTLDHLTPYPRYRQFDALLRGVNPGGSRVVIEGVDELDLTHPDIMLQACNNSFQVHLQVDAPDAVHQLNVAQLVSGPVLAACCNSPVFLGRRLWSETRIALFQRAAESRTQSRRHRGCAPRVSFGDDWARGNAADEIRRLAAAHPVVLAPGVSEDSARAWMEGRPPPLQALCSFVGTTYGWNRLCYGITSGVPHLRIENRVLPAGPTAIDEIANAALFVGLMLELADGAADVTRRIGFPAVKRNFIAAAREGLRAQMSWIDGTVRPAANLVLDELLPRAARGLLRAGVDPDDCERYLGVIDQRVRAGATGARWLEEALTSSDPATAVRAMATLQATEQPGHLWPPCAPSSPCRQAPLDGLDGLDGRALDDGILGRVPSVRPDDPVELAASLARWCDLAVMPVEDEEGRLVGAVGGDALRGVGCSVATVMRQPTAVGPNTSMRAAQRIMAAQGLPALLVVDAAGRLLGVVERDRAP